MTTNTNYFNIKEEEIKGKVKKEIYHDIDKREGKYGGISVPIRVSEWCQQQRQHGGEATPAVHRLCSRRVSHFDNVCKVSY